MLIQKTRWMEEVKKKNIHTCSNKSVVSLDLKSWKIDSIGCPEESTRVWKGGIVLAL